MKITVFTTMPPGVYSGGRYLSLMLAFAMSRAGADVTYVTNNAPLFERDFEPFRRICPIRSIVTPDFTIPPDLEADWVVVIPTGGFNNRFYKAAIDHAQGRGARLALVSFETPNWFAAMSPFPRSPMPSESWRQVVAGAGLVVTIAQEGVAPARTYFGEGSDRTRRRFDMWHPAINDLAAESALEMLRSDDRPRRSITMFCRTEDRHKGALDILDLPPDVMDGHVLSLVFGRGVDEGYMAALRQHFAPARDFAIEVLTQITDEEKFALLARSSLLLFPSYFEGYGYPPVEAAWMGVPTVAWDLPLLREVAGDAVTAVPPGDIDAFAAAIRHTLATRPPGPEVRAMMRVSPDTLTSGQAMLGVLRRAALQLPPASAENPTVIVANGGTGLDPRSEQLLSHHKGAVHLYEVAVRLQEGRVIFSARIEGHANGDKLRISLPHGSMPEVVLEPGGPEGGRRIGSEGQLYRWPHDAEHLQLKLTLLRADRSTLWLGTVDLAPDWPALMAPSADGGNRRPGDCVVLADPAAIAARPLLSAVLSELCAGLRQLGHRATLVAPRHNAPTEGMMAPDILPQFDCVMTAGSTKTRRIPAQVHGAGGLVAATRARCAAAGLDSAVGLVLDAGGEPADDLLLFLPGEGQSGGRIEVRPDALLWGREGQRASATALVVLVPDTPLADLDDATRLHLKRLEKAMPGLRLAIPEALWLPDSATLARVSAVLQPLSPAALAARLAEGRKVVGLRLAGAGDPDGGPCPEAVFNAALLVAYRVPVMHLSEEGSDELRQILMPAQGGPLATLLAETLPAATARGALTMVAGQIDATEPLPPQRAAAPEVIRGDVLALSATLDEDCPALVSGWSDRTILGARIARDHGVVAFRLGSPAATCTRLELMLHLSPAADPGLSIKVLLNGRLMGTLARLPVGASSHTLNVREDGWAEGTQVLFLLLVRSPEANPASKVTLVALSPTAVAAPTKAITPAIGRTKRLAPLYTAPIGDTSGHLSCRFAKGAPPGFARLTAGWSEPEANFTWSTGPLAVMGFHPPLSARAPLLLTLTGNTLAAPPDPEQPQQMRGQRMIVRHGTEMLAEVWLAAPDAAPVMVALPHRSAGMPVDMLFLDFPDALSPTMAGLGVDARLLGLALTDAECRVLPTCVSSAPLVRDGDPGWPVRHAQLTAAAGVLRLQGEGAAPAGVRVGLVGGAMTVPPVAVAGGWEASLPLGPAQLATGRADILWLVADAALPEGDLRCDIWGDPPGRRPVLPDMPEKLTVTLFAVRDLGLSAQLALSRSEGVDLATPAPDRLRLPSVFTFGQDGADVALLGTGWSYPEPEWVWSDGNEATLNLPAPVGAAVIRLQGSALVLDAVGRQRVVLSTTSGGAFATVLIGTAGPGEFTAILPPICAPSGRLVLGLPDAFAPVAGGVRADPRQLALRLQRLTLEGLSGPLFPQEQVTALDEPAILRHTRVADGGYAILVAGPAEGRPFGLAVASLGEAVVVAHALPGPAGWQTFLVLAAEDVTTDGFIGLYVYATAADVDIGEPTDLLTLPLPMQVDG